MDLNENRRTKSEYVMVPDGLPEFKDIIAKTLVYPTPWIYMTRLLADRGRDTLSMATGGSVTFSTLDRAPPVEGDLC